MILTQDSHKQIRNFNENCKEFLESVLDLYPDNDRNDHIYEFLGVLEESITPNKNKISEVNKLDPVNEMSAVYMTKPELVKEKKGYGVSIKWQGHEYRYVSPNMDSEVLLRKAIGMWNHAGGGYQLLNWLKRNAFCYYGCKNPKGKELVESAIVDTNLIKKQSLDDGTTGPNLSNPKMSGLTNESYDDLKNALFSMVHNNYDQEDSDHHKEFLDKVNEYNKYVKTHNLDEITQASAIPPVVTDVLMISEFDNSKKVVDEGLETNTDAKSIEGSIPYETSQVKSTDNNGGGEINESYFNTGSTGTSFYDDFLDKNQIDYKKLAKGLVGRIEYMTPDSYFKRIAKYIFKVSEARAYYGVNQDKVDKYAEMMKNGTKFDLPYINYVSKGQEGRHRILAAKKLGETVIPVLVVTKYDYNKDLGIPDNSTIRVADGSTILWTDKAGNPRYKVTGVNMQRVRDGIKEIIKSGDYR